MRLLIGMLIGIAIIIALPFFLNSRCDGEKVWSNYSGEFEWIDVETDLCCHFNTRIKLTHNPIIYTVDGNHDLENLFTIGKNYTIYLEPYPEQAAAYVGCFWDQVIDYVEDEDGNIVYGWKWW